MGELPLVEDLGPYHDLMNMKKNNMYLYVCLYM